LFFYIYLFKEITVIHEIINEADFLLWVEEDFHVVVVIAAAWVVERSVVAVV
jgi:hypothetical protein